MNKPKKWNGKDLRGRWLVTRKLDGIRARRKLGSLKIRSRRNKPLYNMDHLAFKITDAEIFCGSLEATMAKVRASKQHRPVLASEVYQLDPPDRRLIIKTMTHPTAGELTTLLRMVLAEGGEGLVLRQGDRWLKLVGKKTYDVRVTGILPGKGKHRGKLGALMTTKGKVGTGFDDFQRKKFNTKKIIGVLIEASCKQLTPGGKFRHASFERIRWDKPGGREFRAALGG